MDTISIEEPISKTKGFVDHVFRFDEPTKQTLMNIVQYALLAVIPIVVVNKILQHNVPPADEEKPSVEITLEVVLQIAVIFVSLFFIHRLVTYVPMYSGKEFGEIHLGNVILAFLVIVLSLQTKLGEKVEILSNRIIGYIFGNDGEPEKERPKNIVRTGGQTQAPPQAPVTVPTHQPSQADHLARNSMLPPTQVPLQQEPTMNYGLNQMQQQSGAQMSNFDQMYQEPMAANESFGGFASF